MCAFRISSLFSRPVNTKTPEPTEKKPIRDNSPMQKKRTAASDHVNNQLDGESTKNIKCAPKTRPLLKHSGAESENFNISSKLNPNDEKSLQSQGPISEVNNIQEKSREDSINSRSNPEKYTELWKAVPEKGKALGKAYNLNQCEMAAIRCYSGGSYDVINSQLRLLKGTDVNFYDADSLESFGIDKFYSEIISDLAIGLKKLPPAQSDDSIFRGLGRDVSLPDYVLDSIKEGEIISDFMFTSTTTTLEQMVDTKWWNNKNQAFVIHQRINGNGRDISAFSEFKSESEILFPPDTKFKVTYRKDDAIVGIGEDWLNLKPKLLEKFFDAFPEDSLNKLSINEYRIIKDALGESFPLNLQAAKDLIEKFLQEKFSIDLDVVQNEIKQLHTEAYGGAINRGKELIKTIIALEEILPDGEFKNNLDKSLATSEKGMTSRISSNTPRTEESERKIPVRGQSAKSANKERKIPVRDQSKTTPQLNPAVKPSGTNKEENKSNFKNDDYSISDASNYGEYFPGFKE